MVPDLLSSPRLVECELSPRETKQAPVRAREILEYFVRHPQAADSVEGIARWRLLEGTVQRSVEETNRMLGWLVAQGFLVKEVVTGSGGIFCLNREKAAAAEEFLAKSEKRRQRTGPK